MAMVIPFCREQSFIELFGDDQVHGVDVEKFANGHTFSADHYRGRGIAVHVGHEPALEGDAFLDVRR